MFTSNSIQKTDNTAFDVTLVLDSTKDMPNQRAAYQLASNDFKSFFNFSNLK